MYLKIPVTPKTMWCMGGSQVSIKIVYINHTKTVVLAHIPKKHNKLLFLLIWEMDKNLKKNSYFILEKYHFLVTKIKFIWNKNFTYQNSIAIYNKQKGQQQKCFLTNNFCLLQYTSYKT